MALIRSGKDPRVKREFDRAKALGLTFGLRKNERFITLEDVRYRRDGCLVYGNDGQTVNKRMVSVFRRTARWINEIKFIDGNREIKGFKEYLEKVCGLQFCS